MKRNLIRFGRWWKRCVWAEWRWLRVFLAQESLQRRRWIARVRWKWMKKQEGEASAPSSLTGRIEIPSVD